MGIERLITPPPAELRGAVPQGYQGKFRTAPASVDDPAQVTIDEYGPAPFDAVAWMPRGATLPQAGDPCLVALDNEGDAWVVAWRPA